VLPTKEAGISNRRAKKSRTLLEKTESPPTALVPPPTTADPTPAVVGHSLAESIREDVEHLIRIAGQLFSAIEHQIRAIEVDLTRTESAAAPSNAIVLKEHLIRSATNLNAALQEIAHHLGESNEHSRGGRASFGD
jgi:hypothetical protein